MRRQRRAQEAAIQGLAPPEVVPSRDEAPADGGERARLAPGSSPARAGAPSEKERDSNRFGQVHPSECLTHKTVREGTSRQATVRPARAATPVQAPVRRKEQEVVDAKTQLGRSPGEDGDEEADAPAPGVHCGDVERSRVALGPVLRTAAQVRAALEHAHDVGNEAVVLWGRCSRCGRMGRVVHFDGVLRGRGVIGDER